MSRLDELAAALGKARAAHDRRPDDRGAELVFERARADYNTELARLAEDETRRALGREAAALAEKRALERGVSARIAAVIRKSRPARRRRGAGGTAPLLEGVA